MEIKLIDKSGKATKSAVELSDLTFGREFNEALVHQVVVAYQANARTATRAQLGRGNVSHTHLMHKCLIKFTTKGHIRKLYS